ncbi:uncharacterized protein BO97DRAFT_352547, partial [Aspergillus homomorphus CBS 101889]
KDTSQVLHVYSYDGQTKVIKEKTCVPFSNISKADLKLSDIRDLLVGEKVLEPRLLWSTFCNQRGAKVQDTTSFQTYLQILNEKSSELGDRSEDNADTYRVYLKSKKIIEMDHLVGLLDRGSKVDLDKKIAALPVADQPKAPAVPTSFSHNIFLNPTTTFSIVHPADMSEKHWSVVMRNNSLLHAYRVLDLGDKGGKLVERSLYPSFVLKPRNFWNYQISATAEVDSIAGQKQMLRIPRFRIDDDSYIRQYEEKRSVARAIAESCLSETDAKLAIEGGAFGYSASASASWGESKSSASTSSTNENSRIMTITYNFPRVVIDFDPTGLDLSDELKEDLATVDTAEAVDIFKNKYGRFIATRVQLGGRLHSSEESSSTDAAATAAQAKSMRAAAALSFSSPWVQASASASHSSSSNSSSENKSSASTSTISWEAHGGDTLQCNDPPAWAYTVGSFYNWRVVKQTKVVALEDFISMVPGYQNTKKKFAELLATKQEAKPEKEPEPPTQKTIKFRIRSMTGHQLTVPAEGKGDTYSQTIENLIGKDTKAMVTAERLNFLNKLSTENSQSTPLQLLKDTKLPGQEFAIITEEGHPDQLLLDWPYKIRTGSDGNEQWLGVNRTLSGFLSEALIWAGKPENATYIEFREYRFGRDSEYVNQGSPVLMFLYNSDKEVIGNAVPYWPDAEIDRGEEPKTPLKVGTNLDREAWSFEKIPFVIDYL